MRKIGIISLLAIIFTIFSGTMTFAAGFELVDSYPTDGDKGLQPVSVAIKLHFNEDVSAEQIRKTNEKCFKLVDSDKKSIPIKAYYSAKRPNDVLVLVNKDLESNGTYTFTLSSEFQSSLGTALGESKVINFSVQDTEANMNINMILMVVMIVGMIFFTTRSTKKEMEKEQKKEEAEGKVNPYKIAKETGKPVEEVMAKIAKEKEKVGKKRKSVSNENEEDSSEDSQIILESGNYRVKAAKPISEGGSSYKTGRKAVAEKQAAAKARVTNTNPKNATGKKKNKKKN